MVSKIHCEYHIIKLFHVFFLLLFPATGLKCYSCGTGDTCQKIDCPAGTDRCSTTMVNGKTFIPHPDNEHDNEHFKRATDLFLH